VALWWFRKHRVYTERDGSTSESPYEEHVYLVRVGKREPLWIKASERKLLLEALSEVGSLTEAGRKPAEPRGEAA